MTRNGLSIRLRRYRLEKKLSLAAISKRCGVPVSTLWDGMKRGGWNEVNAHAVRKFLESVRA